ncbi:MAG: hypothetical protein BMS9Abin26_0647 [Gammaproteobacteria bacterium]|nr:MAG: hypothetical protein BMS9Abin26_0647 [Gammaproteobacteria bacterium]
MNKITFINLLVVFALSLATTTIRAQQDQGDTAPPWYQIEVIVFSYEDPAAFDEEFWREVIDFPSIESSYELAQGLSPGITADDTTRGSMPAVTTATSPSAELPFSLLPAEQMQLDREFRVLANSSRYTPRIHVAWRQPVLAKASAAPVYLHSRYPLPADYIETADIPSRTDNISGTVRISVSRYLHVDANLIYTRPPVQAGLTTIIPGNFQLKESRRLRSKELNYLDHPLMGMLVLITPYELPEIVPQVSNQAGSSSNTGTSADELTATPIPLPQYKE